MKKLILILSLISITSSLAIDLSYNYEDVAQSLRELEFPVDSIMEADASELKKMENMQCETSTIQSRSLRAFLVQSGEGLYLFATPSSLGTIKLCKELNRVEYIQLLRI